METQSLTVLLTGNPSSYAEVMRNIGLFINDHADRQITFIHDGKSDLALWADEFLNKTEASLKSRGLFVKKVVKPTVVISSDIIVLSFGNSFLSRRYEQLGLKVIIV